MSVHVLVLEASECVLTILAAQKVGLGFVKLAELPVAYLASEALLIQTHLIGVESGEESAQVGDIFTKRAFAVTEEQRISLGV